VRFLHTADWHVGKTLRGRSRMDEFEHALDEVMRIALEARVDAVLIGGDVFDSQAPPGDAEKLVYDFLARLVPERIACILIAGNHDHPKKLGALAALLEGLRISVRAEPRPPAEGGVVTLASRDGSEQADIAVLPFVPERKVIEACELLGPEYSWYQRYSDRVEQMLGLLTLAFRRDRVNLVVAHLLIAGARVGTGERPLHLGEVYAVNAQQLPANAQYIGLGHLHRPQEILAPSRTFFAGSLLELDFGEREQVKRVVLVEAHPGRAARIESVPLGAGRKLRDLEGTLAELEDLRDRVGTDFLRVRLRVDGPGPGLAERVRELFVNAVDVQLVYERRTLETERPAASTLDPRGLFSDFYRRRHGAEPPADLVTLFGSVYEEASS
jgi:exonuclease SbcD